MLIFSRAIIFKISVGSALFLSAGLLWASDSKNTPQNPLEMYRSLVQAGQDNEAFRVLQDHFNKETSNDAKARMAVALGIRAYNRKDPTTARGYLEQAIKLGTRLDDYAELYLGKISADAGLVDEARKHFETVRSYKGGSVHGTEANYQLVQLAISQKKWNEAQQLLTWLERKARKDVQYPRILKDLMYVALVKKQKWQACKWAPKYYSKFAADSLQMDWGLDLSKAKVKDIALGCVASPRDMDKRFKNLMLSGEFEETRKELDELSERAKNFRGLKTDLPGQIALKYGELFLASGRVSDAIDQFNKAREAMGANFTVAMLLAKAYSRTDDYLHAVEWYLKAYKMKPRAKMGRLALFQAAFLSYQNRDYDGAARRFEEFVNNRYSRSAEAADAKWHLAWIRYLKADYEGALKAFEDLSRRTKGVDLEKITYWRAMSYLRLGQAGMARIFFDLLAKQRRLGYYTAAALARLTDLPPGTPLGVNLTTSQLKALLPVSLLSSSTDFVLPSQASTMAPSSASAAQVSAVLSPAGIDNAAHALSTILNPGNGSTQNPRAPQSSAEDPGAGVAVTAAPLVSSSEEKSIEADPENFNAEKTQESAESDDEESGDSKADESDGATAAAEPAPPASPFKNPVLLRRFDKASDLLTLGFDEWAKEELREIEKRTINHSYLQTLMSEYTKSGDYFHGAYIADVVFAATREKGGLDQAFDFWIHAFPQAYQKQVVLIAKRFDVPQALIWAIMRAESTYKTDVKSQAGALGLMQLIPPTAHNIASLMKIQNFRASDLLDTDTNILFGAWYLKRLIKIFQSDLPLAIAGYNAGPHRVQGWLRDFGGLDLDEFVEHIPYLETRNYTKKVLRNIYVYKVLYEKQVNPLTFLAKKPNALFEGPKPEKENWDPI